MEFKSVGMMTFPTEWKNNPNVPNHQPGKNINVGNSITDLPGPTIWRWEKKQIQAIYDVVGKLRQITVIYGIINKQLMEYQKQ